ncbi:acid protease [Amniculicola lignicola CBS 123094]|uniref:Acid protease n=1 Tax=Amniculicola lignicola CBS 123094 TaxID=1392246 RepID=A0A6A5W556_9PLEO|nr:acid protease [Amniculicola lignicola CBS 123094]
MKVTAAIIFTHTSFFLVTAQNCTFDPVSIPFKWITLPNKGFIRGGALSVGTPPQNFSFLPIVETNNTFLFLESDYCQPTKAGCMTLRGGFFTPDDSKTYQNDTAPTPTNSNWDPKETLKSGEVGADLFMLNENNSLPDFPFGITQSEITVPLANGNAQTALGLGRNSTILSMLEQAGTIGSKSWGYWWGLDGATERAKMDGNLVLGGYDRAKIKNLDNNYTGNFMERGLCPQGMAITINEVRLNFPNGSEPNLLQSAPLQTCVCPQCPNVMSMRYDPYYARFEEWTGFQSIGRSVGINFFDMMYRADEVYQGDLTLVLGNGLSIRIPNHQLAIPDRTIDEEGQLKSNSSVRDLMLYSLQDVNKDDMPRVGRVFFTSAYLWVNNDEQTFTIWEANPTEDTDIVAVTDTKLREQCSTSATTSRPGSTSVTNSALPAANTSNGVHQHRGGLSGGAIGGIVVGALVLLGVIGFALFWFRRKAKPKADADTTPPDIDDAGGDSNKHVYTLMVEAVGSDAPEAPGHELPPQELWGGGRQYTPHVHELSGS